MFAETKKDPDFMKGRIEMYRMVAEESVFGNDAPNFISTACTKARERLQHCSRQAQDQHRGNQKKLVQLAGQVKYALAHIELAECYGRQIGILTEHELFRRQAVMFISLFLAEVETIEYFD